MPTNPIRVTVDVDTMATGELAKRFRNTFDKRAKTVQRQWSAESKPIIKKMIINRISKGLSPVAGAGRYVKYSQSYKKQIKAGQFARYGKRIRPINLRVTGKMLKSIRTVDSKYGFEIYFGSKLAIYHDEEGAGRSKTIRRILPDGGERFTRDIDSTIKHILLKTLRRNL